jgi:hypothetical protein
MHVCSVFIHEIRCCIFVRVSGNQNKSLCSHFTTHVVGLCFVITCAFSVVLLIVLLYQDI